MSRLTLTLALACLASATVANAAGWPPARAPIITGATGYIDIPGAAVPPTHKHVYRAVFDATRAAGKPADVIPALDAAGSELNALGVAGVPMRNAKFVIVFHGGAIGALLDDAHYQARFGMANPNLPLLQDLRRHAVELDVGGQDLAADHVEPAALTPLVRVASDALIVLVTYQNEGYALLSF